MRPKTKDDAKKIEGQLQGDAAYFWLKTEGDEGLHRLKSLCSLNSSGTYKVMSILSQ